jgi:transposase-like protein
MSSSKTSSSSAALAASERSGEAAIAAGAAPLASRRLVPDSEVVARPVRRRFTAEYKRSILDQADAAQDSGAIGALLRREGLYSSHLGTWRRQRKQGVLDALTAKKRGPKVVVSPLVKQNREQQAVIARLTKKLKNAELIIEVQKKVAALLGNPIPNIQIDEENS